MKCVNVSWPCAENAKAAASLWELSEFHAGRIPLSCLILQGINSFPTGTVTLMPVLSVFVCVHVQNVCMITLTLCGSTGLRLRLK